MRWQSHRVCTFTTVTLLTGNIIYGTIALLASCVPDIIDGKPPTYKNNYKEYWNWRTKHRTISHWPLLYIFLYLEYLLLKYGDYIHPSLIIYTDLFLWFIIGCILHILEDALCGKVPLTTPKSRYGIKLFKVASTGETFFIVIWAIILWNLFSDQLPDNLWQWLYQFEPYLEPLLK